MSLFETRTATWESGKDRVSATYRYVLEIVWDLLLPVLIVIMMNPSTADEYENDPTVARVCERARRRGFGGVIVLNAHAFRATDPTDMLATHDSVGPDNDFYIRKWLQTAQRRKLTVMVGWGQHGAHRDRDKVLWEMMQIASVQPVCLDVAKNGQPVHPLYQSYDKPFVPWRPAP